MGKPTKSSASSSKNVGSNTRAKVLYSDALVLQMMDEIASGVSVREMCLQEGMPHMSTFFDWLTKYPAMVEQYNKALASRAHLMAEQVLEISDDGTRDYKKDKDGNDVVDHDHIARARLRVDSRKWLASKFLPKVYGDKMAVGGAEDLGPVRTITRDMTGEEAYALMMTGKGKLATASQESNEDLM